MMMLTLHYLRVCNMLLYYHRHSFSGITATKLHIYFNTTALFYTNMTG